jgi:23S rRNA pseudouridine1911/1915/1917 synthase
MNGTRSHMNNDNDRDSTPDDDDIEGDVNDDSVNDDTSGQTVEIVVSAAMADERLDRFVSAVSGVNRAVASDIVRSGGALVDGVTVQKPSTRLAPGAQVSIRLPAPPEESGPLVGDPTVDFDVLYVDSDVIVVNKPAGLVVHPGHGNDSGTLVHGLLARFPDMCSLDVGPQRGRPGIVHRLDRGTSGVLMVARTPAATVSLIEQLSQRRAERRYVTIVEGNVGAGRGVIDAPIGRHRSEPTKMTVDPAGKPARTHYDVVARTAVNDRPDRGAGQSAVLDMTALGCSLETGRTHQIRVHMASIGHPVVGDQAYGARMTDFVKECFPGGLRPALHAWRLSFDHPRTGDRLSVTSQVPDDLRHVISHIVRDPDSLHWG